jgi:hypothetical protein
MIFNKMKIKRTNSHRIFDRKARLRNANQPQLLLSSHCASSEMMDLLEIEYLIRLGLTYQSNCLFTNVKHKIKMPLICHSHDDDDGFALYDAKNENLGERWPCKVTTGDAMDDEWLIICLMDEARRS